MPRLVSLIVLIALAAPLLPAQEGDFRRARKNFERSLKREDLDQRMRALEALLRTSDPEIVDVMVEAIVETSGRIRLTETRVKRTEEKIAEELYKRVEKPRVSDAQKREALEKTTEKLAPEYAKVKAGRALIEADLAFRKSLEDTLPQTAAELSNEEKGAAATQIAARIEKSRKGEAAVHYARALGAITHPAAKAALIQFAANSLYPSVRVVCLDALHGFEDDEAEAAGIRALGDEFRQVRSAGIELLKVIGSKLCLPPAIEALASAEGITKGELRSLLEHLTKHDFNDNAILWKRWYDENVKDFEGRGDYAGIPGHDRPPRKGRGGGAGGAAAQGGTNFYGIETTAKNVVYVLDISGSMTASVDGRTQPAPTNEQRVKLAVNELIRSINSLPGDATFNIVFYETKVFVWRESMQSASKANKGAAESWAKQVKANGQTNIYDALEKAFEFAGRGSYDKEYSVAVDSIFLLSDGSANQGRYTANDDMLAGVARLNNLAKIEINGIAVGSDSGFLRRLAESNRGQFVLVR